MVKLNTTTLIAGGVVLAGVAFYLKGKFAGGTGGFFQTVGEGVGGAAVDLAGGVLAGVSYGVGDAVGLPRTNLTQCQQDLAAGNKWDASFSCSAGDFIKSFW